ncbi:MAG: type II toxin-antitoxin system HicB family antitoxin [Patescibacteria group bacterium]|jgi:predicted RNase H-like HicB family nuclease
MRLLFVPFFFTAPDLPGSISDGETIKEAILNGRDAFLAWISSQADMGREIPKPWYRVSAVEPPMSEKFVERVPRSLHAKLSVFAKQEGATPNTLLFTFIAKGGGMREEKHSK